MGLSQSEQLGCMVHARRQSYDYHHATQSTIPKTALDFFACLYKIEGLAKDANTTERTEIRHKYAVPVVVTMKKWLDEQTLVVKTAELLNAISYSLTRYAQDHCLAIDNNLVENNIKPIAIGKRIGCLGLPKSEPKYGSHLHFINDQLLIINWNTLNFFLQ